MSGIIKITNRKTVANKKALKRIQEIMRAQFPGLDEKTISNLPYTVFGGPKMGFNYSLYAAADDLSDIRGFMMYSYFPRYSFYFLDHIAAAPGQTGRGIGGMLYSHLRTEAKAADAVGVFYECLSDDPGEEKDKTRLEQNKARLRFYERFGARPLAGNLFHERVKPENNSALLVYDPLDQPPLLTRDAARKIVRKIILKKYSDFCPPDYIKRITLSFKDNPVQMRETRYKL